MVWLSWKRRRRWNRALDRWYPLPSQLSVSELMALETGSEKLEEAMSKTKKWIGIALLSTMAVVACQLWAESRQPAAGHLAMELIDRGPDTDPSHHD